MKIKPAIKPPLPELPRVSSMSGNQKGPMKPQVERTTLMKTPMLVLCSTLLSIAYVTRTVVTIWLPTAEIAIPI